MNKISIEKYLLNAASYWPESHYRNVKKIDRFIEKGCGAKKKSFRESYIRDVVALSELRLRFKSPHLYIVNAGSSGSHWLEAMLGFLPGFHNGGEIYLPPEIKMALSNMGDREANLFLDALYLVHCGGIYPDMLNAFLSNSAHLVKHQGISQYSLNKKTILLTRNPVDIAMSRTFRKDEYKNDVAPNATDIEYLEKNCLYVENFYKNIEIDSFDHVVRYESLVESPKEHLKKVVDMLALEASEEAIDNAIKVTSKDEIKKSVESGSVAATNVYLGEKKNYQWAQSYTQERLRDVIASFGY
ncbi:sulfotransferase domain-containing protein [Vreelandella venusta]|uniref:sulfotransferase domain-containing protein n=1 Tax=Vreelandella venusta TaxID=44935 RepID=UPI003AA97FB4